MSNNDSKDTGEIGRKEIAPAKGKLGIMMPGMGAVATTFVAGVEAVGRASQPDRLADPDGHHPPGQAHRGRSPQIKDFVPLAELDDLVFGGWDIFEDDMYAAAQGRRAGARAPGAGEALSAAIKPRKAVFDTTT